MIPSLPLQYGCVFRINYIMWCLLHLFIVKKHLANVLIKEPYLYLITFLDLQFVEGFFDFEPR